MDLTSRLTLRLSIPQPRHHDKAQTALPQDGQVSALASHFV
jgi:hypothetical protein